MQSETRNTKHVVGGLRFTFHVSLCTPSSFVIRHSSFVIRSGFTLIELMLVMAVLTIAVSLTAPALANFFRGRSLDSEARRLLSLTHQGQSRAVSEGIPMELWLDAANGSYGLEADASYEPTDSKALEFPLDKDLQLAIETGSNSTVPAGGSSASAGMSASVGTHANLPKIRFLPDGSISETSPQKLRVLARDGTALYVAQSRSRLNYEIQSRNN
jgi:prepilin-type N-terminal cleavage/methylation domain-containing protein